MDSYDATITEFQGRIREQLAGLRDVDVTTGAGRTKARAVLDLTAKMIAYEERVPALRSDEERGRLRPQVRVGGMAVAGAGVLVVLCAVAGWVPGWRLIFAVPLVVAGVAVAIDPFGARTLGARQPVDCSGWRTGMVVGAAAALAVLLATFGVSWWLLLVGVVLAAVALVLLSRASAPPPLAGHRP